jgi:hypothetical protein
MRMAEQDRLRHAQSLQDSESDGDDDECEDLPPIVKRTMKKGKAKKKGMFSSLRRTSAACGERNAAKCLPDEVAFAECMEEAMDECMEGELGDMIVDADETGADGTDAAADGVDAADDATADAADDATTDAAATAAADSDVIDYTDVPKELDAKFSALDPDGALRPTIIHLAASWTKTSQTSLLTAPTTATLDADAQREMRVKAFDLLDALTKSGALPVRECELHVVVAATHCFATTLMGAIVEESINPVDKLDCSSLIVASTIHGETPSALIRNSEHSRVTAVAPTLMAMLK